jgi:RimJ/RimL family protein N-acetyltransferase
MTLILTGPRLALREFAPDDWEALYAFTSRPDVSRYQAWGPNTPEDARAHISRACAAAGEEPRTAFTLAVTLTETGQVVGGGDLYIRSQRFRSGEIAYLIDPAYWGRGFATEVARLLLRFGFAALQLHRIAGTCDPRNVASARVLEKVGMRYEGRMRETLLIRDGWRDSALYSILEQEWAADRA